MSNPEETLLSKRPISVREDVDQEDFDSKTPPVDSDIMSESDDEYAIDIQDSDLVSDDSLKDLYKRWMECFKIDRDEAEQEERFPIFKESVMEVHELNNSNLSWTSGLNIWSDTAVDVVTKTLFVQLSPSDDEEEEHGDITTLPGYDLNSTRHK